MKLLLENWHKYLNETGFGEGTPAPGKWSEKKTYIVEQPEVEEEPEVEEYSDEKEYEELGSTEERYGGSDRDKMIYAIHFFEELEQRYPDAAPEDAETIVDDLVGDPGTHRDAMISLVKKVLTPGATLTGKAPKPDSQEELQEIEAVRDPLARAMDTINLQRAAKKAAEEREERGELPTIAGTQNLDHLDPRTSDPEEEFFGDKVDPDDVGLQTGEWTPEQFRKLMSRNKR